MTITFPLAPADAYAWPGGYPIGYLMDDGECLCAQCMNDDSNPVHAGGDADGWRLEGLQVLEGSAEDFDGPVSCAHCGAVLVPDDEEEHEDPTPDEDDAYVRDAGSSGYSVSMCGRARGWIADMDDAVKHLAAEMEATSYFPNVWYVNDHGNATLLLVTIDPELGVTWDFTDVAYV